MSVGCAPPLHSTLPIKCHKQTNENTWCSTLLCRWSLPLTKRKKYAVLFPGWRSLDRSPSSSRAPSVARRYHGGAVVNYIGVLRHLGDARVGFVPSLCAALLASQNANAFAPWKAMYLPTWDGSGATELITKPCPLVAQISCTFSPTSFSYVLGDTEKAFW